MGQVALDHGKQKRPTQRTLGRQCGHAFAKLLIMPVLFKSREPGLRHSSLKGWQSSNRLAQSRHIVTH